MFFRSQQSGTRMRVGQFVTMRSRHGGGVVTYVVTPAGFVKIHPEAVPSINMRFAVYRLFVTFLALTTLACAFIAAVK